MCTLCRLIDEKQMTVKERANAFKELVISETEHRKEIWKKLDDEVKDEIIDSGFWDSSLMEDGLISD